LADFIDITKEKERLNTEMTKVQSDIKSMESRLANEHFVAKALPEVIEETQTRLDACKITYDKLHNIIGKLK
jgi:valyl-tRNA synthetase